MLNFDRMVLLSIKSFRNMASILGNKNSTRLLISFSFLLLLAVANSSTDNGTVEPFTSSSYTDGETVELLTSSFYPDRMEPQHTTSSYSDSGTESQQQTSSFPDNGTEQQQNMTSSPRDSGTEQQNMTSSLPESGTEQQNTRSYTDSETEHPYTSSNLDSGTEQQPTLSLSPVIGTEQPAFSQNPNKNKIRYPNNPTIESICTNSSLQVYMSFLRPYEGVAFANGHSHNTLCSILTHPSSNATEVILELPFNSCGNRMRAVDAGVLFYNTMVIQQHRMIPTRLDSVRNVSCVLHDVSIETFRSSVRPATPIQRKAVLRLDNSVGSDLFPDARFRPANFRESELYVVVQVADLRRNKDMVVRNCIAHDQRIISNQTNLYQLSNFYGCPDDSSWFGDFTVTNQSGEFFDLMAYAKIKNFTMFANRQLYITCGVTLCVNACQPKCDEDESERYRQFSRVVVKKMVQRPLGATTPSTLRLFTESSERVKRSVGDVFSNIFRASRSLLDNIVKENRRQLAMLEASTEGSPFLTDFDLDQNETTMETIASTEGSPFLTDLDQNETTTMETTSSEVFLDEDALSTGFEVSNASTDAYLQEKVSYLKKGPIGKSKAFKNVLNGEVIPLTSELFVCILFCIVFGSIFCFVCKNERR